MAEFGAYDSLICPRKFSESKCTFDSIPDQPTIPQLELHTKRGNWESHLVKILVPPVSVLLSLPVVIAYASIHLFHVIGMLLRLVGLKERMLGTQSLGLDWPLSKVGTGLEQNFCSSPHRLIIRACLPGPETENTHTYINTGASPRVGQCWRNTGWWYFGCVGAFVWYN